MFSPISSPKLSVVVALCLAFIVQSVQGAGMVPETPVVIVDQGKGEATLTVRNTDAQPALLHSSVIHLPQDQDPLLVLSPPVARVEPGQSQQVRFILHTTVPLKTERLKRVQFEGIQSRPAGNGAQIAMGVRQNIPVILRPAGLAVERAPWKRLVWSAKGGLVRVNNPSPYVVRLARSVSLIPGGAMLDLGRTYILPGEVLTLSTPSSLATHVRLFPATTYGFATDSYDAHLSLQ
ncbi:fimbria/pilus chaperone family protein [Pseudomonas brassicacearum]|uniref:fimbria/pilus chaperone family protein n=1 Tax=Pseudomonas brassicacearum TaxID=930166 RepID=UPI001297C0B9|nr:fimbria/pilus chaperone family protein [Pseudomonas brassicacearum]QGA52770.1 fimbria/pilus periplasmic chaperone [Pseudomonas brassicacearum]